jgi:hypothetical protein
VLRALFAFAPALLCVGTMFVCFRMMSGKHHEPEGHDDSEVPRTSEADQPGHADR